MASNIERRLVDLGLELPVPGEAAGNYVAFVTAGDLVFLSGQVPVDKGVRKFIGKLGRDLSVEEGQQAAQLCVLNLLARLKLACAGDLERVVRCVKVVGFINGTPEFADHPKVMNGASDVLVKIFGDAGRHARSSVGVGSLPFGVAVEVEAVFQIKPA